MMVIRYAVFVIAVAWALGAHAHGTVAPSRAEARADERPVAARESALARTLTLELLRQADAHGRAGPGQKAASSQALVAAARERQAHLLALAADDPAEVLRVAVPAAVRGRLPGEVRELVEEAVEAEGELEVIHVDHVDSADDFYVHTLATAKGRYTLHFADVTPDAATGAHAKVRGVRLGESIVVDGRADVTVDKAGTVVPNTLGPQKTLAILVNFSNAPTAQPYSPATVQAQLFGTTSGFEYENSYQQTTLTGSVAGWFTIATTSTACDFTAISQQARAAAQQAGYVLTDYARLVYIFPSASCSWWGLGTVGGMPSHAWIHTRWGLTNNVVGHELGHNLGLFHAHSLDCGYSTLASSGCTASEYGDVFDLMGANVGGHYSAYQKERLGWLDAGNSPPITTVPAVAGTATFDIAPLEDPDNGLPRALRVPRTTACGVAGEWFYVEARQAKGYDGFLATNANVLSGVLVHKVTQGVLDSGYLLDMTPSTSSWSDAALTSGKSYTDTVSGVKIATVSAGPTGARVSVTFPAASCTRAAPKLTLAPGSTVWTPAGVAVGYTVSAQNNDGCGCAPSAFDVSAAVPAGWSASSARTGTVSPGATTSAAVFVTPPSTTPAAFYSVTLSARNASATTYVASASATVAVESTTTSSATTTTTSSPSLSAAVRTSSSSYKRPAAGYLNASIITTVTRAGAPVAGATVRVETRDPYGRVTANSATTNSLGNATVYYTIKSDSPAGTYTLAAKATQSTATATAAASFSVTKY